MQLHVGCPCSELGAIANAARETGGFRGAHDSLHRIELRLHRSDGTSTRGEIECRSFLRCACEQHVAIARILERAHERRIRIDAPVFRTPILFERLEPTTLPCRIARKTES